MGGAAAAVNSVVTWLLLSQSSALAALPTIKKEARPSSSPSSLAGAAALGRHEPQHASASHGRELQSSGCRSDICGDSGNDCCAYGSTEPPSCQLSGYVVTAGGTSSYGPCLSRYGQSAIYQCCPPRQPRQPPPPFPPGLAPAPPPPGAFANRAALLVARDAWCADPTAAAAIYGPISLWDISQVTDLSFLFCADSCTSRDCNPACSSFNSDISGWDTSIVTTLYVRAASHPLHPSPPDTHALCLAFAYHSLCRVQETFAFARAFNQPLEAWDVSRAVSYTHLTLPTNREV